MASIDFDLGTIVPPSWLNDVDEVVYGASSLDALRTALAAGTDGTVGFVPAGTGAVLRTERSKLRDIVNVADFGAVGDNVTDDLAAFNLAMAATPAGGEIHLTPGKTYRLSAVWTWPTNRARIILRGNSATIRADHNGHGIDLTAQNESYSRHYLENVWIQGPNVSYPNSAGELAGTSTGGGIKIHDGTTTNTAVGYQIVLQNVMIRGFLYGRFIRAALLCKMIGGAINYCQYGDYWDGGQANANSSICVSIRENRRIGVASAGTSGGSLTNATRNVYYNCTFETNIPYRGDNPGGFSGGYPTAMNTSGTVGVAVYLFNSYDFSFAHNYYENQDYSVNVDGSSDHTTFIDERFDGNGGVRIGGVKLTGAGTVYTKFLACHKNCANLTEANIESNHADHVNTEFLDCRGFNLIPGSLTGVPYVRNMGLSQSGGGMVIGDNCIPFQGRATDVQSGTAHGQIETIGSATATLHCQGFSTIVCNTAVAAAGTNTTITVIDMGVQRDFCVKILNLQATRVVTIANNAVIKTKTGANVAIASTVGVIMLWIAPNGTAYEI